MMNSEEFISRAILTAIVYKALSSITRYSNVPDDKKINIIHKSITNNINEMKS